MKTKVYVGIPSTGTVADIIPHALRQYEREYGDKIEFIYPASCVHRKFHDFARNEIVEDFLKTEADILWFLDSDIVPPPHLFDLITKHGEHWELAGAPYPVFMTPSGYKSPQVVMCVYTADETGLHASKVPFEGQRFVDGLATGCLFIKREVFKQLAKPYFEFKFDAVNRSMTEGEDLGFCKKVNELGYKFFTDFSMVCGHYKDNINLIDVNAYAIQYAKHAIESYDAQIREQIKAAVNVAYEKGLKEGQKPQKTIIAPNGMILPDYLKV